MKWLRRVLGMNVMDRAKVVCVHGDEIKEDSPKEYTDQRWAVPEGGIDLKGDGLKEEKNLLGRMRKNDGTEMHVHRLESLA